MTGSGKTLTYILPILNNLSKDPFGIYSVIFSPSRELAEHIHKQIIFYGSSINVRSCLITGGSSFVKQTIELDKIPHVIVATPGRFYEILKNNDKMKKYLKNLKIIVFDEFDKLMDKTLMHFLGRTFSFFPKNKQFILTTSTFVQNENSIERVKKTFEISEIEIVNMNKEINVVNTLKNFYIFIPYLFKDYYFLDILTKEYEDIKNSDSSIIVFFKTCKECYMWYNILKKYGIRTTQLHSYLNPKKRNLNLVSFKEGRTKILLTTDLSARGLDFRSIDLVIHYNFPITVEDYVHRSGRAARGGRRGRALAILTQYDIDLFKNVEKKTGTKFTLMKTDKEEEILKIMNKLDRVKRKLKIHLLVKGKNDQFKEMKKKKIKFQKQIDKKVIK